MFTREDTKAVKGIAVILMLFHHLTRFPERYAQGFDGFKSLWKPFVEDGYLSNFGATSRLCVAIFFFVGGYGLYKRISVDKFKLTESIKSLYINYWKIFLIFIPIAFIFFNKSDQSLPELCLRYHIEDGNELISTLLSNFLGLSDSLNSEWWFFSTYLCLLPMGVLFFIATKKSKSFTFDIFLVFVIDIFVNNIFPDLSKSNVLAGLGNNYYFVHFFRMTGASPFFAGIVMAKHNKLEEWKSKLQQFRFSGLLGLIGCIGVLYVRGYILGELIEVIHAIAFTIFASLFFYSLKYVKKAFSFVGKYSMDMWLVHTFFCYYFYEATKIVYATSSVWVDWLILIALSLVSSILVELIWKGFGLLKPKLQKLFIRPEIKEAE